MSDYLPRCVAELPLADLPRYHIVPPHPRYGYSQFVEPFHESRHGVRSGERLKAKREIYEGAMFVIPWWFSWANHRLKVKYSKYNPFWKAEESRPAHLNAWGRESRYNLSLQWLDQRFFYMLVTRDVKAGEELCLNYGDDLDDRDWVRRLPEKGQGEGVMFTDALRKYPTYFGFPRSISAEMTHMQLLINSKCPVPAGFKRDVAGTPTSTPSAPPAKKKKMAYIDLTADSDSE